MAEEKASLLDRVKAMGAELGLEGEDLAKYVDQHMQKAGWTRRLDYDPPEGNQGSSGKSEHSWF